MAVYAFQPRKIDPPHFVAEDREELDDKVGEIVGGEQCDYCGNSAYRIERVGYGSPEPIRGYSARCVTDEDDDAQFTGCGRGFPITLWEEDLVVF